MMHSHWLLFAMGFFPYALQRRHTKNERLLSIRAFFWSLTIRWQQKRCSWKVSIPLIEQFRK